MLKRFSLYLFLLLLSIQATKAQEWELGALAGASGYIGDLNPTNPIKFTNPAISFNIKYNFDPFNGLKLSFTQGEVQANDADSKSKYQQLRNLNFNSSISELALVYEFNFYEFIPGSSKHGFTPYAFFGFSGFLFNPKTEYNGQVVNLRDLGTEGQGTLLGTKKKYSNLAFAIPFGMGIKYNFASNYNIGFELGYRNTFTDYLDDVSKTYVDKTVLATTNGQIASDLSDRSGEVNSGVYIGETFSQRGDDSRRDFFMFTGITISYTFTPIKCPPFKKYR